MKDYTTARFWAISSIGYGKGFTPEEALDNYVRTQMRNYPAKDTVFKTRPAWKEALTSGEARPDLWQSPEGFTGFVLGMGAHWTRTAEDGTTERREFTAEDRVTLPA